ncbi:DUF6506 family protein [Phenylobacterium sp.]|uniref:DUF6506 family protein n=1 Tax=Phenylobacterium sp. TaxID=1871053 RepID=UPI00271B8820|nr:DUF6506 family protein [Phenylobacterium sp.]MDO8380597.1 DUF6506 family protein [Phenylobacterium sp.]
MALSKFGFIVTGAGFAPVGERAVLATDRFKMIAVGVPSPGDAVAVAVALVAEGVQLLELCGGFGPVWTAEVIKAIGGQVPVGAVGYGPESIDAMYALFKA